MLGALLAMSFYYYRVCVSKPCCSVDYDPARGVRSRLTYFLSALQAAAFWQKFSEENRGN
jgi:hypothetical protein